MGLSTAQLRKAWKDYECAKSEMKKIAFGPDRIRVASPTIDAWKALASVMAHHGYEIRTSDTDSYNCRQITGGTKKSLHSYGIALDVNWTTNPYIDHSGNRAVRFSGKATQAMRANDVKRALADTDMTPEMIDDVVAIRTTAGKPVFDWGGHFKTVKDCMHFEIDLSPRDLAAGINWSTVKGAGPGAPAPVVVHSSGNGSQHQVTARRGLRLRAGPGTDFDAIQTLSFGTSVYVVDRSGDWAQVDLEDDGQIDGHVHASYLQSIGNSAAT